MTDDTQLYETCNVGIPDYSRRRPDEPAGQALNPVTEKRGSALVFHVYAYGIEREELKQLDPAQIVTLELAGLLR